MGTHYQSLTVEKTHAMSLATLLVAVLYPGTFSTSDVHVPVYQQMTSTSYTVHKKKKKKKKKIVYVRPKNCICTTKKLCMYDPLRFVITLHVP